MENNKCPDCGLDYEIAAFCVILEGFGGVCHVCGNPVEQKRIAARWTHDTEDLAGRNHHYLVFPFTCPHCNHIHVSLHINCFHPVDVSQEFLTLNGSTKNG